MRGQGRGMERGKGQGHGICRAGGQGRKQGMRGQACGAGRDQGFRLLNTDSSATEPGMPGMGRGRGMGVSCGRAE